MTPCARKSREKMAEDVYGQNGCKRYEFIAVLYQSFNTEVCSLARVLEYPPLLTTIV